jgi:hypothetical protein
MASKKTVTFYNTPSFYLEYTKNWLAQKKAQQVNPAEIAVVSDICKLVEIAVGVLDPVQSETATKQN